MDDATKIAVAEGATLSLGGNNAVNLLNTKVVGSGTVAISENTTIDTNVSSEAPYTTLATGTLLVKEGKSLTLGTDKNNHYLDFSSFSAVELENGASI
ncbi:MAG: hypothetical protein Q4Q25_03595, partial [Methanocorpusculum sp.]|nr:hypothetical protein [Methanocorpusculum sp.]